jgi:elongation factor 1-alpha
VPQCLFLKLNSASSFQGPPLADRRCKDAPLSSERSFFGKARGIIASVYVAAVLLFCKSFSFLYILPFPFPGSFRSPLLLSPLTFLFSFVCLLCLRALCAFCFYYVPFVAADQKQNKTISAISVVRSTTTTPVRNIKRLLEAFPQNKDAEKREVVSIVKSVPSADLVQFICVLFEDFLSNECVVDLFSTCSSARASHACWHFSFLFSLCFRLFVAFDSLLTVCAIHVASHHIKRLATLPVFLFLLFFFPSLSQSMLEKEVFRICTEGVEQDSAVAVASMTTPAKPASMHPPASATSLSADPSPAMHIETPLTPSTSTEEALRYETADAATAAAALLKELPFQCSSCVLHASPRAPAGGAFQDYHAFAERAATSFRQDRRLQRGQIGSGSPRYCLISQCSTQTRAPVPVSPTWTGLPDSMLHAATSPTCLPLPSSDNGISCTNAAADVMLPPSTVSTMSAELGGGASACQPALTAEDDEGDVEYKWRLTGISATRFQHLVTQMQFRVLEGRGQCLYELGVSDDGTPRGLRRRDFDESVQTIQRMAAQLRLEATLLQCCLVSNANATHAQTAPEKASAAILSSPPMAANMNKGEGEGEGEELLCGEIMVSRRHSSGGHDLSVAFCGAVGCGKSTLMAVLLTARLDDGCGGTRQSLFNHKHELDSGRTSSLASRVWTVSPDAAGMCSSHGCDSPAPPPSPPVVPGVPPPHRHLQPSWLPVSSVAPPTPPFTGASPRSITLLDAGGDITKTMLFGLMSRKPDYVCVCAAADTSDASDVSLYAEVCCAMNTPFIVVLTKCDCVAEFELDGLMMELTVALERVGCVAEQVSSMHTAAAYCRDWLPRHREAAVDGGDAYARFASPTTHTSSSTTTAATAATAASQQLRVPVFWVSSVEGGEGLDLFRSCLSHLQNPPPSPPLSPPSCASKPPFEVLLDCAFDVENVGPVVHGRVAHGPVEVGCICYIGPGSDGRFYTVLIRGIHVDGEHVNMAQVGDEATFALDRLPAAVTVSHKGKVLVRQPERVAMSFEAVVQVLSQSISEHMEPIMYTRNARQAVNVVAVMSSVAGNASETSPDPTAAQDGQRECRVQCRFLFRPEVIGPGDAVVLHWAPRGIAVGRITAVDASGECINRPSSFNRTEVSEGWKEKGC